MAVNELFDSGIKVTGSFSAAGAFPVDGKFIVETIAERDDHVTQNRAYEGMLVYVKADGKTYQLSKDGWIEFGFNEEQFQSNVYNGLDSESALVALSAKQGKVLNDKIVVHTNDATIHITNEERQLWNAKASTALATVSAAGLMSAADKSKLDGIVEGANKYEHPATHEASIIVQDASHRFVSDAQITAWTAKPNTKADIGLENVTNDTQVKRSEMGVANGVATLDANGLVPSSQLPSYVDDVLEYNTFDILPGAGESGKIYVTKNDNKTYRWTGTQYIEISSSLALGETSATAYAGDKGKALADTVAGLLNGNGEVAKAQDAETVNGFTVGTNVPADAKFTDTTYSLVTQTANGLMSASDKVKLDTLKVDIIDHITYTMSASTFSSAGKVVIPLSNITDDDIIIIGLSSSVTLEQYDAAGLAKFITKEVSSGIEVSCLGTAPTIDIPVQLSIIKS